MTGKQKISAYRKKAIEIEAVQLNWRNWNHVCDFPGDIISPDNPGRNVSTYSDTCGEETNSDCGWIEITLPTLEGEMVARHGDWIIKGIKGEFYPCKPDIFDASYEPAAAPAAPTPEPLIKAIEQILDEQSAWIARPNKQVTERIAMSAAIVAMQILAQTETGDAEPAPRGTGLERAAAAAAEKFIQAAIDSAPEPLRRLGEWLANKLDDDDFKTADRLLIGAAAALARASEAGVDPNAGWQSMRTAPKLDRLLVAGWKKPRGRTVGYWWWREDFTDENGTPIEHPNALMWLPAPSTDDLPCPPDPEGGDVE